MCLLLYLLKLSNRLMYLTFAAAHRESLNEQGKSQTSCFEHFWSWTCSVKRNETSWHMTEETITLSFLRRKLRISHVKGLSLTWVTQLIGLEPQCYLINVFTPCYNGLDLMGLCVLCANSSCPDYDLWLNSMFTDYTDTQTHMCMRAHTHMHATTFTIHIILFSCLSTNNQILLSLRIG